VASIGKNGDLKFSKKLYNYLKNTNMEQKGATCELRRKSHESSRQNQIHFYVFVFCFGR